MMQNALLSDSTVYNMLQWSLGELKDFLSVRDQSVCGNIGEPVARAFVAKDQNISITFTEEIFNST